MKSNTCLVWSKCSILVVVVIIIIVNYQHQHCESSARLTLPITEAAPGPPCENSYLNDKAKHSPQESYLCPERVFVVP